MRDAQIDESRFFSTVDDIDRNAENSLCRFCEYLSVVSLSQCIGTDCADFVGPYRCQKLLKAFKASKTSRYGVVGQLVIFETFAKLHFLSEDVKWTNLTVLQARHDQVK